MFKIGFIIATLLRVIAAQTTTLEAEYGSLCGVTVATSVPGYTGSGYVEGFDASTSKIIFAVYSASSSSYNLNITYRAQYSNKYTQIVVNSADSTQVSLPGTTAWSSAPAGQVSLNAGWNAIEIQSNWGWYSIDSIEIVPLSQISHQSSQGIQSRSYTLSTQKPRVTQTAQGTSNLDSMRTTGSIQNTQINRSTQSSQHLQDNLSAQSYQATQISRILQSMDSPQSTPTTPTTLSTRNIQYSKYRQSAPSASSSQATQLSQSATSTQSPRIIPVTQSTRSIQSISTSQPTQSPSNSTHNITTTPVNPNANSDAKALLKYLGSIYGKHILSGQQDATSLDWITQNVGKTPAMLGIDMMDYTQSRIAHGVSCTEVEKALAFAQRGGIITSVWDWGAPTGLYNNSTEPWYSGFYTAATSFDIETALADTTNANYKLLMNDIDTIAVQLKRLQSAGVPADGKWFWWGAHGSEPCKKLWRILYQRLTYTHVLNNLIWVWNSVSPDWYPGDDVVDIVSADTYTQGNYGPIASSYDSLVSLTGNTKIVAAAEVGSVMQPAQLQSTHSNWVYFVAWSGDFVTGGSWNSLDLLKSVYDDAYVLTLDRIQGWKNSYG